MFDAKVYKHKWYCDNKERMKELNKIWHKDNPEKNKEYQRKKRENNPNRDKIYYRKNAEKIKIYNHQWYLDNKEKADSKKYKYAQEHKKERNEYLRNKYKTDLKFNLNIKIQKIIGSSLKGNKNGRHWEDLVGYNLKDLIKHLNKTMPNGYYWNDVLTAKLHIDHIIPISAFNFTQPKHTDFKRCWALSNLRLLPAKENIRKSNKITKPFQPALAI